MRADRLLSILLSLQAKGRMTARELAQELEVSERTIYRDMEALSMAGIPVVAERGIQGGWQLLDGYRTTLNGLKLAEIQALFLHPPASLLADLGLEQAAQQALLKLLASLPQNARTYAETMQQRLYIDLTGWQRSKEEVTHLPTLQAAVWGECQIRLGYRRGDGEMVERVIDPLGLVAKGSVWYLVAGVGGELHTYRVSRVVTASILDSPCSRPPNFDLPAYWAQSMADFQANLPRYSVTVRVAPQILSRLRYAGTFAKVETIHPPEADGWSRVEVHFDLFEEAREYVLGFGTLMHVLEPPELREAVMVMARAVYAVYATEPENGLPNKVARIE